MKFILAGLLTLASAQALAIDVTHDGLSANPWCEKFEEAGTHYMNQIVFGSDAKLKQVISEIAADGSLGVVADVFEANWVLNGQIITLTDPADATNSQDISVTLVDNGGLHLLLQDPITGDAIADLTVCK